MMGATIKIYDCLHEAMGEQNSVVSEWAQHNMIMRKQYRGGTVDGNACRKLLKRAVDLGQKLPDTFKVFAVALCHLNDVVHACFGQEAADDYEDKIKDFKQTYLQLGISVTPKVHAIFNHVP